MALLHIAFQEGFTDDVIVLQVNGKEVLRKDGLKTRLQIGYADSFEMTVDNGPIKVGIILPLKNLSETIALQMLDIVYIGVSLEEGKIRYKISCEPFGYL